MVLIAGWWLCQPILLYAFSWLTGDAVFVPRYLQLALPGAAFASTAMAAPFIPAGQWRRISTVFAIGVFLFQGQWRELWPRHHNSDWRAAARSVNQLEAAGEIPVICPSPFIEARPPAWRPDYPLPGFLYAHLAVYPISGKTYLFPFENSPEAEAQASTLAQRALSSSRRFLIYGWGPQVDFWRGWFASRPEFAGWHQQRIGPFADVDVVLFEAAAAAAGHVGEAGLLRPVPKYTVSEVHHRIAGPLADARGSVQSHDREGVVFWRYETVFAKPCTKLLNFINTVSCPTVAWALRMPR